MATSSITKSFVIKDKEALKRFNTEMKKQPSSSKDIGNKLEEGRTKLTRYLSR